jgi:dipeptidyl aminopeptidase/acylaminoacyl peptidase
MCDPDVPYQHADKIVDALATGDVELTLIKDGDHRLSRDRDLALLRRTLAGLVAMVEGDEKP